MKIVIDTETGKVMAAGPQGVREVALSSDDGWRIIAQLYRATGRHYDHSAPHNWCGEPVDQSASDLFDVQDVVFQVRPHFLVLRGAAAIGTVLFYASVLQSFGGRVLLEEADLSPECRQKLAACSPNSSGFHVIPSGTSAGDAIAQLKSAPAAEPRVMVMLGSTADVPVSPADLERYAPLVSVNSWLVVTGEDEGNADPSSPPAALQFALEHAEFRRETPERHHGNSRAEIFTDAPRHWLRRVK